MVAPSEKLAASLALLEELQKEGRRIFRSKELPRVHRERLVRNGYLREVIKGWLISSSPEVAVHDTTSWFASFWKFCASYSTVRFGQDWHLSPEQSLLLQAENTVIPQQVVIYTPKGANNAVGLPFGTSLYDLKRKGMPADADLMERDGLRLFVAEAALVKVPQAFFVRNPVDAQIVLSRIPDASYVLGRLLDGGHSAVAGRIAGAFRRMGRGDVADEIIGVMKRAGYDVRESDPFGLEHATRTPARTRAPIIDRLQSLWESMREPIVAAFPAAPGQPKDAMAYMSFIDETYRSDAYHSLSIEDYQVTPELIERVRTNGWDLGNRNGDQQSRDALAARGYWQAFQLVRETVGAVIAGDDPAVLTREGHQNWYRELFQPSVAAGLVAASALAGYRNSSVFLRGSRYVPPRPEAVRDAMPAFFDLLESESEPSVKAVLGHWLFGYIHPYPDGNGRMARFVMNVLLASGGYPWTVIRVNDRDGYLAALDVASINQDMEPFARFLAERVRWTLRGAK